MFAARLGEQPFQKLRFWITTIAAELSASIVSASNHLFGNTVAVISPGCELHVPAQFFHLSEELPIALDRANFVLVSMKGPYREILNQ